MIRLALLAVLVSLWCSLLPAQSTQDCTLFAPCDGEDLPDAVSHELCCPDGFNDLWNLPSGPGFLDIPAHYVLQRPATECDDGPRPLLILFRGVGNGNPADDESCPCSEPQCYVDTNRHWSPKQGSALMDEASQHGWYSMSPLGAPVSPLTGDYEWNFGVPQGILNLQHAIREVLDDPANDIDRTRIYAIGFSMGGANLLAYASRHLDPEGPYGMFAGIAILSGATSNSYRWVNVPAARRYIQSSLALPVYQSALGCASPGSPTVSPLDYQKSSGVYTGCDLLLDAPEADGGLAWNLRHLPFRGVFHEDDPRQNIEDMMDLLDDLLSNYVFHPDWIYQKLPTGNLACVHCWDLYQSLDIGAASDIFEWFEQKNLCDVVPLSARVLVPESSVDPLGLRDPIRYFYFKTTLRTNASGGYDLGEFTYDLDPAANRLTVSNILNVKRLRVRTETSSDDCIDPSGVNCFKSGLNPTAGLTVIYAGPLARRLNVVLEGYVNAPSFVARQIDGGMQWQLLMAGVHYFHDPVAQTLRLKQNSFAGFEAKWVITP